MGQIDDYLNAQVTPQLVQGEQIMCFGFVRRPYRFNVIGVPTHYEEWLATATNLRLILYQTEAGGLLTPAPKPLCREVREWWYQDLKIIQASAVAGVTQGQVMILNPHEPLGPYEGKGKRYDVFPTATGVDGQAQFFNQYRPWIQQQVAAGAFPMDAQRAAAIQAHQQQQAQAAELKRQQDEEKRQRRAAQGKAAAAGAKKFVRVMSPLWLFIVVLVLFGGCTTTGIICWDETSSWEYRVERLADEKKRLKEHRADKPKPSSNEYVRKRELERWQKELKDKEGDVGMAKYDVESKESEILVYGASSGVGALLTLVAFIIWLVINLRRRKAFRQEQAAAAGEPPERAGAVAGAAVADPAAAYGQQAAAAPAQQPAAPQAGQPAAYGQPTPGYGQPPGGTAQY